MRGLAVALALLASLTLAAAEPVALAIASAEATLDAAIGQPVVIIRLSEESKAAFGDITAANIGRKLELRIDGEVITAPIVREPIRQGTVMISGSMTEADAKDLAERLSNGAARVEVEVVP